MGVVVLEALEEERLQWRSLRLVLVQSLPERGLHIDLSKRVTAIVSMEEEVRAQAATREGQGEE